MPVTIKPENLKAAARLLFQFKPTKVTRSRSTAWNGLHRLVASGDKLKISSTDGSSFLEWIIPHEGQLNDAFDMTIDADQFNNVSIKLSDGDLIKVGSSSGYLTLSQGHRNLRMAWQAAPAYPEPERSPGQPAEPSQTWDYPTTDLAKGLAFVAGYINSTNPSEGKAVATLDTRHELTAGTPSWQASVVGLNATLTDLSLSQKSARQAAAFLGSLSNTVRITADELHYTFTSPQKLHTLIVPRECVCRLKPQSSQPAADYERFEVDRKELASSTTFLATVVTAKTKPLEFRISGRGENASLRIMTPFQLESDKSEDTLPILRTFHRIGDAQDSGREPLITQADELKFLVNSEQLRGVLSDLEGKVVLIKYFPRGRMILVEEDDRERSSVRRMVKLLVGTIDELTEAGEILADGPRNGQSIEVVSTDAQDQSGAFVSGHTPDFRPEPHPEVLIGAGAASANVNAALN